MLARAKSLAFSALTALWCLSALPNCAAPIVSSKIEDNARRVAPIPVCFKSLNAESSGGGAAPAPAITLRDEDYWGLIFPSYDAGSRMLSRTALTCNGKSIWSAPEFAHADPGAASGISPSSKDLVFGGGADGIKIVWMRTHVFSDGGAAGPLALVRSRDGYAEVFGVGVYRGNPAKTRFSLERLGPDLLVTALDDGCADRKGKQVCDAVLSAFLPRLGQLLPVARFSVDRVDYQPAPELGLTSAVEHHLSATPTYLDRSIRVLEQLTVRDTGGRELRRAELERNFTMQGGTMAPSADSIWGRFTAGTAAISPTRPSR